MDSGFLRLLACLLLHIVLFGFANYITGLIVFVIRYYLHSTAGVVFEPRESPARAHLSPRERPARTFFRPKNVPRRQKVAPSAFF